LVRIIEERKRITLRANLKIELNYTKAPSKESS